MRRYESAITDNEKIKEIILSCHCCRLGFCDNNKVYIVPLHFGYRETENSRIFYFHGAKEGKKVELIKKNRYAGFELDTNYQIHEAETACYFSARYQSVIGSGAIAIIEDSEEKKEALQSIMEHNSDRDDWIFSQGMLDTVCVFKLIVEEMTYKDHA